MAAAANDLDQLSGDPLYVPLSPGSDSLAATASSFAPCLQKK